MCTFGVHMAATGPKDHRLISEREREKRLPHLRTAAGAQTTQFQFEEVVTRNNDLRPIGGGYFARDL